VKYAVDNETGRPVAIKILDKEKVRSLNMDAQIRKEVRRGVRALSLQRACVSSPGSSTLWIMAAPHAPDRDHEDG
jgi:hypothetical protein